MFSSVTNWLGGDGKDKVKEENSSESDKENQPEVQETQKPVDSGDEKKSGNKSEVIDEKEDDKKIDTIDEVSAKALNTAKEWGNYLFNFGKAAGKTVADTAKQITKSVEEKTFFGEFTREQEKFVTEKKEKSKQSEAAVPPWVGYNEEETMKSQILALSSDKRNFLRNPPSGVQYQFEFQAMYPIAMATLQEDPNLSKMRFELVPKQIKEEVFWRNYFYRVSLIKQSTQLTSLAQETGSTGESRSSDGSRRSSVGSVDRDQSPPQQIKKDDKTQKEEEFAPASPQENEFVSDAFQADEVDDEDLRKEMQLLGVDENAKTEREQAEEDSIPQWEKDLQQELQEYEMVNDGGDIDDADLENEILQQIEQEAKTM